MSQTRWTPVEARIVEAARQARARGLSLRAISAELAAKGILGPSGGPYLPGSIAAMVRDRDHIDRAPALAVDAAVLPVDVIGDDGSGLDAEPAAPAVDVLADPIVDAAPLPGLEPPIVDAAPAEPPAVDKPRWEARRFGRGLISISSPAPPSVWPITCTGTHEPPRA